MSRPAAHVGKRWNLLAVLLALGLAIPLQMVILACLCHRGTVKVNIALSVDLLVLLRVTIAGARKQRGKGWIFYAILPYLIIPVTELAVHLAAPH